MVDDKAERPETAAKSRVHSLVLKGSAREVHAPTSSVPATDLWSAIDGLFGASPAGAIPPAAAARPVVATPVAPESLAPPSLDSPLDPSPEPVAAPAPPASAPFGVSPPAASVATRVRRVRVGRGPPGLRLPRPPAPVPEANPGAALREDMRSFSIEIAKVNLALHLPPARHVDPWGMATMRSLAYATCAVFLLAFLGGAMAVVASVPPSAPGDLVGAAGSLSSPFQAGTSWAGPHDIVVECHKPGTPAQHNLSLPLPAVGGHDVHGDSIDCDGSDGGGEGDDGEGGDGGGDGGEGDDGEGDDGEGGDGGDGGSEPVEVCHLPDSNPHTILVAHAAVPALLAQGDSLGACPDLPEEGGDGDESSGSDDGSDDSGGGAGTGGGGGGGAGGGGGGGGGGDAGSASSSAPAGPAGTGGGSGGGPDAEGPDNQVTAPEDAAPGWQGLPRLIGLGLNVALEAAVGRRSHREGQHAGEDADQGSEDSGEASES